MPSTLLNVIVLLFIVGTICFNDVATAAVSRLKRQTYVYDEMLRQYARPHPKTKISVGTLGRYAPWDWPGWYVRTIFVWNGAIRMGPYHPNDVRYEGYKRAQIQSLSSNT